MLKLSFSKKQIIKNFLRIILVLGGLSVVAYFALNWSVRGIISRKLWLDEKIIFATIATLIGVLMATIEIKLLNIISDFFDRAVYDLRNAIKGNQGEKKAFDRLLEMLGSSYQLYRNVKISDRKFDIDAVIVGPKGIIAIEIKNLSGEYRFVESGVYKISRYPDGNVCYCELGKWKSPAKEAIRHGRALEEWLMRNDFNQIKVRNAILMVGDSYKMEKIEKPEVYVIDGADGIEKYFVDTFEDSRFTPEFCAKLNQLFEKL
ncbi:MAG: nuclease-related domain-containing protein [Candidatus Paceibacterota bacterium]|jgi:hypothetical protein